MSDVNRGRYEPSPPPPFPGGKTDATRYPYAWNRPDYDHAAANELTPEPEQDIAITERVAPDAGIEYLTPDGTRRLLPGDKLNDLFPVIPGLVEAERLSSKQHERALRRRLVGLPSFIRQRFLHKLNALDLQDPARAVKWLFGTFERHVLRRIDAVNTQYLPGDNLPSIFLPFRDDFYLLPWANKKRLKQLAHSLANLMQSEFMRESDAQYARTRDLDFSALYAYGSVASKAATLNIAVPGWSGYCSEELEPDEALRATSRLQSEKWWLGKLKRIHDRWREHLLIVTGHVSKRAVPYCSDPCFREWQAQQKANMDWLRRMELEDQDTGERTPLLDKVLSSVSNPKIARHELMVRMRGFQDIADEMGLTGMFYTLTAPSCYHATHAKSGRRNDKYNNATPRQTQKYLCGVWSRVRAQWARTGIRYFGFRVTEPHHDETPHWHLLLFLHPDHVEAATEEFRAYALEKDGNERGAREHRFTAKTIEEACGSATAYIAKYISKNIDGYGMDGETDHETGKPVKEMARRVRAWASRWGIRQFQPLGGSPVTVWRELRRIKTDKIEILGDDGKLVVIERQYKTPIPASLLQAQRAADDRDWRGYIVAQGGPFVPRSQLQVRLTYEITENGNDYGDDVKRINGVYCPFAGPASSVFTRTVKYKIVPRQTGTDKAVDLAVDLPGRPAAPWSSVNNCTQPPKNDEKTASSVTELPQNIGDLRRYTRRQRREITDRLREACHHPRKPVRQAPAIPPQGEHIRKILALRDIDVGVGEIHTLLAGGAVACGDLIFTVTNGQLHSHRRGTTAAQKLHNTQQAKSLIDRFNRIRNNKPERN